MKSFIKKSRLSIIGLTIVTSCFTLSGCNNAPEDNVFTITWANYDGTILKTDEVNKGVMPSYIGAVPQKPEDDYATYSFYSWTPTIVPATKDATYTAIFQEHKFKFTIKFVDYDGTELKTIKNLPKGQTPTPPANPTREDDGRRTYTFVDWSPEIGPAVCNQTYKAVYASHQYLFTATWKNYDNTILEVDDDLSLGDTPEYNGVTPTKPSSIQGLTYEFDGWSPEVNEVTKDITYVAQFKAVYADCQVKFLNYDGNELQTSYFEYGEMPVYTGETPVKPHTDTTFYIFDGWTEELSPVTSNTTYTAKFKEVSSYLYAKNKSTKSTYKIVVPSTTDNNVNSAITYFNKYFNKIAKTTISTISDSSINEYSNNEDYIYFGNTKGASALNIAYDNETPSTKSDYQIRVDNRSIVINGGSLGLKYAAVELLRQMFDFDFLASGDDNYWYDKERTIIGISDISSKVFDPLINYRTNYISGEARFAGTNDYAVAKGLSSEVPEFSSVKIDGIDVVSSHNALMLLPYEKYGATHKDWFTTNSEGKLQLCYSHVLNSEEALNIIYDKYVIIANAYPDKLLTLKTPDNWSDRNGHFCNCAQCLANYNRYGNDTGSYILLLNKLGDMIKEGQRKGEIPASCPGVEGIAYYASAYPPTKNLDELYVRDNVYMEIAPNYHNRLRSYKECETTFFDDWNKVLHGNISSGYFYSLDDYSAANYMFFHNDFDVMLDNMDVYKNAGIDCIIQLGAWNNPGDPNFGVLRTYLFSYLMMNNEVTQQEFNKKIDDFFTRYYGPAADAMKMLWNTQKQRWNEFKLVAPKNKSTDFHYSISRINSGVSGSDGYFYNVASDYGSLASVSKSKQRPLYSNVSTDYFYIGKYEEMINNAVGALNDAYTEGSADYKKMYNRVVRDCISPIYVGLECFNRTEILNKSEFIKFLKSINATQWTEGTKLSELADHWNVTY